MPLTGGAGWIPRRLDKPFELGRYLQFVESEVRKYVNSRPVKAAKRALSMASLLLYGEAANALSKILRDSGLDVVVGLAAASKSRAKATAAGLPC